MKMPKLLNHLEVLADEGIRINFGKNVSNILVCNNYIGGYVYIGPEIDEGVISVVYVPERSKKLNLQYINSGGYNLTQVAIVGKGIYNICHTKEKLSKYLENAPGFERNIHIINKKEYEDRLVNELEFAF